MDKENYILFDNWCVSGRNTFKRRNYCIAESLSERLQNQKNQLEQNKELYEDIEEEKESIEIQKQKYDVQIEEERQLVGERMRSMYKNGTAQYI